MATRRAGQVLSSDHMTDDIAKELTDNGDVEAGKLTPILWHSNAPWVGTGYGAQTALFAPLINEQLQGYRVAFSAFYGLKGSRLGWVSSGGQPYIVYPGGRDAYGNDVIGAHGKHWYQGDQGMTVLLTDPWVMNAQIMGRISTLAWCPIDHDPIIPRTLDWFRRSRALPLAMSRFGERVMQDAGLKPLYAPHGFHPGIFMPQDRAAARASLNIPQDAFVVAMVAANRGVPSRKGYPEALSAFRAFQEKHPDAQLYLHTKMEEMDGEPLHVLCHSLGIRPIFTDQYALALGAPPQLVARVFNAADVLLNPSHGEGFGVPIVESQACGTPTIVTDFSSMPEVAPASVGNWNVEGTDIWTAFESWQMRPSVDAIVAALEEAYAESNEERLARRQSVYTWAVQEYAAEHVLHTYFKPVLQDAMHEIRWRHSQMERY